MIRFINFLFLVCHIYLNWNERTLTYTPFHEFLILSAIKSVFRYWMRQLLKTCFVPKQNHLILLCYWTHHVIHEINTLAFSSNSKTRFIFTFILYLYWFTDCCLLHLTWVTTLIVGLCGHLHPLPTKTWPPQLRMRCWTRRCFQY